MCRENHLDNTLLLHIATQEGRPSWEVYQRLFFNSVLAEPLRKLGDTHRAALAAVLNLLSLIFEIASLATT